MPLLLLILWPVAELFVAIEVARAIGVLLTVVLLIASWPVGVRLLAVEGRGALRRLNRAAAEGRAPGREVLDGALVLSGGLLLIIPGFITDVLGLALLIKPLRALGRRVLERNIQSRLLRGALRFGARPSPRTADDVDSTAHDIDRRRLPH
jgi:UPF0716 protein FxsA